MATFSWNTGTSGLWNIATNWTPGTVPNDTLSAAIADVTIDAKATTAAYLVTIAATDTITINSLTLNATNNAQTLNQTPFLGAVLEVDGTLKFAAGSAGLIDGPLQNSLVVSNGTIVNAGTINAFVQATGVSTFSGNNGIYFTNWLQSLGTVFVDTASIAEFNAITNTLTDGIFEAKGSTNAVDLGGSLGHLVVNIGTIQGPGILLPGTNIEGWTQLIFDGPGSTINEWNGTAYVPVETTIRLIQNNATISVNSDPVSNLGRNYSTANALTIGAQALFFEQAGTLTTGGLSILNGGTLSGAPTVVGSIANNGTILASGGGMILQGGVTGTGSMLFDTGANTLEVHGVSAGQTVVMNGTDTLQLDTPGAFAGTIQAKVGDKIVLQGVTATSAVDNNGTLIVLNGAQTVASLALVGDYSADHFTTTGSTVTVAAGPPVATASNFTILDTTTNVTTGAAGDPYTGPVAGLQSQIIDITTDSLNITALVPNVFLRSGSGTDGLNVSVANGNNVLDGSTGSNFLTGGTGNDTFYMDDRAPTSPVFSTIVNFHSGDNATVFGVNATDFHIIPLDNQGAAGFTGLDLIFTAPGHIDVSFVLAGYTSADLNNGRLTSFFGTTPDLPGLPGSQFFTIHGT